MKRFTSIFLVINILLCYSGLQLEVFASTKTSPANAVMGCHGNSHITKTKKSTEKTLGYGTHGSSEKTSSCCLNGLTNAPIDPPSNIYGIPVHTVSITNLYYQNGYVNRAEDFSQREHDPPDLQIVNSTFLL
jgi:hypothetical protein